MIREDSIQNAMKFLTHQSVQPYTRDEKISFLKQKGLTGEEIEEAFKRVEHGSHSIQQQQQPQQQPQVVYVPQPVVHHQQPPQDSWSNFFSTFVAPASLAVSAGASLLYFYKTYVLQEGKEFPWESGVGGLQPPPLLQDTSITNPNQSHTTNQLPSLPSPLSPQQQPGFPSNQPWSPMPTLPNNATNNNTNANNTNTNTNQTSSETIQLRKAIEDQSATIREMLSSLKDVLTTLKEKPSKNENDVNLSVILQALQASGDVKSELNTIKTLLLANFMKNNNNTDVNNNNNSTLESTNISTLLSALSPDKQKNVQQMLNELTSPKVHSKESKVAGETPEEIKLREGIEKARNTLGSLVSQCPDDELLSNGCGMMLMFLKNLLKDPLNPRYRRIAKINANFKKSLEPLKGYLEFFETVGFEEHENQLELMKEWTENLESGLENGWAKLIIEDAIANLETVREQKSPYANTATPSSSSARNAQHPFTRSSSSTNSLPKWQLPSQSSFNLNFQEPVQNPMPPPAISQQPQHVQNNNNSKPTTTDVEPSPTYPTSFAEIVRLQQEGKRPDGIKDIPDRISSDEPSKPNLAPLPKPWERNEVSSSSPTVINNPLSYYNGSSRVEIQQIDEEEESQNGEQFT